MYVSMSMTSKATLNKYFMCLISSQSQCHKIHVISISVIPRFYPAWCLSRVLWWVVGEVVMPVGSGWWLELLSQTGIVRGSLN